MKRRGERSAELLEQSAMKQTKSPSVKAKNRRMFSRQAKQLDRGQRNHVKQIFAWADKSSVEGHERDRICERARQINSSMQAPDDWFRFADEVNALFREIEQLDPVGYAKMQHQLEKKEAKKSKTKGKIMEKCRKVLPTGRCTKNAAPGRKLCAMHVRAAEKATSKPKKK